MYAYQRTLGARDYQYKAPERSTNIKVGLEASQTGGG
jgi:hypothetical protein